jgi:hypothetical protein
VRALACPERTRRAPGFPSAASAKAQQTAPSGKLDDVANLDSNLFSIAPDKIKDAVVRYTILRGKPVYDAGQN